MIFGNGCCPFLLDGCLRISRGAGLPPNSDLRLSNLFSAKFHTMHHPSEILTKVFKHMRICLEGEEESHTIPFDRAILEKRQLHEYAGSDEEEVPTAKDDQENQEDDELHMSEDEQHEEEEIKHEVREEHEGEIPHKDEEQQEDPLRDFHISDVDMGLNGFTIEEIEGLGV
ncbi:proline-, glutamic acid- and leucine-rich protein 1-like isoform X3 [Macadamia integrifolia]|uniref:proline-, glutamic acid- and leucine-rich protein 1-like isoform X3 n=1 Tax=Macadamia integrifolia TaxID=60698 RepID=UPI001C4EBFE2|nr:proline-, glutamic acid- and leucine-rich protein 1-like isoform X3 [Macadamia integrifolia]